MHTSPRLCLVTGANRGIGLAIAQQLIADGHTVFAACRSAEKAAATAALLGPQALPLALDVTNEASIQAAFAQIAESHGKLDVLVNNAGIGRFGSVENLHAGDYDATYTTNVRGPALCCQAALPLLEHSASPYVIGIGSVVSVKGYPEQGAYTASKHAMQGFYKSLAAEWQSRGIRVSTILPGGVETDMATAARPDLDTSGLMAASDVAEAVAYLLSLSQRVCVDCIQLRRVGAAPF